MALIEHYANGALPTAVFGFRLTTAAWESWRSDRMAELHTELRRAVHTLELGMHGGFGHGSHPFLLTVCTEDVVAPGVPTCVPNVGLNKELAGRIRSARGSQAMDQAVGAFLRGYGAVVAGIPDAEFGQSVQPEVLRDRIIELTGRMAPLDPWQQLSETVAALFATAEHPRALGHRRRLGLTCAGPVTLSVRAHPACESQAPRAVFLDAGRS